MTLCFHPYQPAGVLHCSDQQLCQFQHMNTEFDQRSFTQVLLFTQDMERNPWHYQKLTVKLQQLPLNIGLTLTSSVSWQFNNTIHLCPRGKCPHLQFEISSTLHVIHHRVCTCQGDDVHACMRMSGSVCCYT